MHLVKKVAEIYRILLIQASSVVLFALVVSLFKLDTFFAVLSGGAICCLPNLYFCQKYFAYMGASRAKSILRSFYLSEIVKWLLSMSGFLVALYCFNLSPLWVLIGYIAAQIGFGIGACVLAWQQPLISRKAVS